MKELKTFKFTSDKHHFFGNPFLQELSKNLLQNNIVPNIVETDLVNIEDFLNYKVKNCVISKGENFVLIHEHHSIYYLYMNKKLSLTCKEMVKLSPKNFLTFVFNLQTIPNIEDNDQICIVPEKDGISYLFDFGANSRAALFLNLNENGTSVESYSAYILNKP